MEEYFLYCIFALIFLLLLVFLILLAKVVSLGKRFRECMAGSRGSSLEEMLVALHSELRRIKAELAENRREMEYFRKKSVRVIQGLGVVRYNAFWDTGGDLSFSVALLDGQSNGVVISSIYGREETRTYAKPLENGKSKYELSSEEKEAITKAREMLLFAAQGRLSGGG